MIKVVIHFCLVIAIMKKYYIINFSLYNYFEKLIENFICVTACLDFIKVYKICTFIDLPPKSIKIKNTYYKFF